MMRFFYFNYFVIECYALLMFKFVHLQKKINMFKKFISILGYLIIFQNTFAQNIISGKVLDSKTSEAIIGANVDCGTYSTITDIDGKFEISVEDGKYDLSISYLSYITYKKELELSNNQIVNIDIALEEEAKNVLGQDVVITGSLFERKASEEVISIEVVKPQLMLNVNALRIDEVARRVSGLNVADGQANIRAGSGWAYGVGSRVMFIVDGQPMLSPDRGDVKWTQLPTEAMGQLEVLKGASSVLYGSSAMNGTIHLQTVKPTKTPLTRLTTFQSFILPPKDKVKQWWDFPVLSFGATFLRAHKPKDNFEYFVSGSVYLNNMHFENAQEYMARLNYRTKWISKKNPKLSYGVAGSLLFNKEYEFFFWQNMTDGAYKAAASNDFNNIRVLVDPFFTAYDKKDNKHEIKTRSYFNRPSFNTKTFLENIDYNFSKNFKKIGLNMVVGANDQFLFINVPAFVGGAVKFGNLFAIYTQLDKKFKDRVTLSGGLRWETYKFQSTKGFTPPIARIGMNARVGKQTYIRFNLGQAFRFPSFAERFVNEGIGDGGTRTIHLVDTIYSGGNEEIYARDTTVPIKMLKILPNQNLKPEYGWTSEIGLQQHFKSKNGVYSGVFDFAFYWQEYRDLVDINGTDAANADPNALISMKFENISRARIAGWDMSYKNTLNINKHNLSLNIGYTYAYPQELNLDSIFNVDGRNKVGSYIKDMFKNYTRKMDGYDAAFMLKYRNRHLATFDVEYTYNNKITVGMDARYYSKFERYDFILAGIDGISDYYNNVAGNEWVLNGRFFYTHKNKHTFGAILKNMLNNEYWLRAGKLEQPMSLTFQYRMEF